MGIYLTVIAKDFDATSFIKQTNIKPDSIWINARTKGVSNTHSGFSMITSSADFNDFKLQVKDTIKFLNKHKEKLKYIKLTKEIQTATLTFVVQSQIEKKGIHSAFFPRELIRLAGELLLDIEITLFSMEV